MINDTMILVLQQLINPKISPKTPEKISQQKKISKTLQNQPPDDQQPKWQPLVPWRWPQIQLLRLPMGI